ncbi:hypothetical protein HA402_014824 [Bradysia odoriphaga]|nr:hypothetical protein HA402_014824 [Bradysia odoriphaga]
MLGNSKWMSGLNSVTKFVRIRPIGMTSRWEIMVRDLTNDSIEVQQFDAVMCCNGHYSCPRIPDIPGRDLYGGKVLHTHSYRTADIFKGETVLVVGCGSSGVDVSYLVSKTATKTTISFHDPTRIIPSGIHKKPDIRELTENGAIFQDGTEEHFTVIIFATGYLYSFPFLSIDCGITIDDNYIQPLFKHCININYPTMALIGMPYLVHPPLVSYLQIQLFLKYLSGSRNIPSKEDMMSTTNKEMDSRWKNGFKKKQAHTLGTDLLDDYYGDLCQLAGLPPVKPYMMAIYRENQRNLKRDHVRFREINFTIIDDEHFVTDKELY